MWIELSPALSECQRDRSDEPHILARSVERRRLPPRRRRQKSAPVRAEELGQESAAFGAIPVRHEHPIDVRTLWSLDSGLQLLSVSSVISRSLLPCLNSNLVFSLHQAAFIGARSHMTKTDVAWYRAK